MKKRFLVLIVCICALCGMVISVASAAAQSNSLISKSYLEGIYFQELRDMITSRVNAAINTTYNAAAARLNTLGQGYLDRLSPAEEDAPLWLTAADFLAQSGESGDTVTLAAGSGLIWTMGEAQADGILIDLTDGIEMSGALMENHRYLATEEVVITLTGKTAYWSVEGEWQTTADGIDAIKYPFTDVPLNAWYYDSMKYVVDLGLFKGVNAEGTLFDPNGEMTRSMLATVFYRMNGSPEVTYEAMFSDVPDGAWYTSGTLWLVQNGMASGVGEGKFNPTGALTRQQLATMFYNYANWLGLDTSARGDLGVFPDGESVASWASDGLSWAIGAGLVQGNEKGELLPKATTSRAQVATLLQRFDNWMNS